MRKLLVLALVLSVVGLANAGLSTTNLVPNRLDAVVDTVAQTITFVGLAPAPSAAGAITGLAINMVLDVAADYGALAYVSSAAGFTPTLGDGFEAAPGDWAGYSAMNVNGIIGNLVVFSYTGTPGKATLYSSPDWGAAEVGIRGDVSATSLDGKVIIIPEPMTMLLLGLGGLFLRKK